MFALAAIWSQQTAAAYEFTRPTLYDDQNPPDALGDYIATPVADGIALHWDGVAFEDDAGNRFAPPAWFVQSFPPEKITGFMRGKTFDSTDTIKRILRRTAATAAWRRLHFVADDLPDSAQPFAARRARLTRLVGDSDSTHLRMQADTARLADADALARRLDAAYKNGEDGILLRHQNARYGDGGERFLLARPYAVGEAVVRAHRPGKGEFAGMLGSIEVESAAGDRFIIASGFSHLQRRQPPPLQSRIAYKYRGFTATGKPKSPVFLRRIQQSATPPLAGAISTTMLSSAFVALMTLLAGLDALTFRRRGRHWDFKSPIVSVGLLGTFIGIWWGLYNFNAYDIAASVPALLDGLKLAFVTSIVGMALSTTLSIAQTMLGRGSADV